MQVLARRRGWLVGVSLLVLFVLGILLLRSPLEIPSLRIEPLARIGGYPLRNSVVETWLGMLVLIAIVYLGTRRMRAIPGRLQGFLEVIVEWLLNLVEGAAGKKNGRRFFPVVATIFLFVVSVNWLGLLPGVGTVGIVVPAETVLEEAEHAEKDLEKVEFWVFNEGPILMLPAGRGAKTMTAAEYKERRGAPEGKEAGHLNPFVRPASTDINTPLALAIWSFIFVEFWGISTLGFFPYMSKFFNFRQLLRGKVMGIIDVFVGFLELILELVRLLSFTFRLFFNILAGEILIVLTLFLVPIIFVGTVFGMEVFFGAVQAFIFAVLTLIFGILAVASHGGTGPGHEADGEHQGA